MSKTTVIGAMLRGPKNTLSSKRGYTFWMVLMFTTTVILAYLGKTLPENIQTDIYWLTIAGVTSIVGERAVDVIGTRPPKTETKNIQNVKNATEVIQEGA